jgi:hypothetical protein
MINDRIGTWWHTNITLELGMLRHEDHEFEVSLDYIVRLSQKKEKKNDDRIKCWQKKVHALENMGAGQCKY